MQTTVERPTIVPWELDEEAVRVVAGESFRTVTELNDIAGHMAESIAYLLLPGVPVPGLEYPATTVEGVLERFKGKELDDWCAHIERRAGSELDLTGRIAPAACDLIIQTVREGRGEQEHVEAVLQLARAFVPRSEDLRSLQVRWLARTEDDDTA